MNIEVSSKLMLSFLMGMARHALNNKYAVSLHISRKNWVMKLMFYMLINVKVFYKLMLLFLMGWAGMPKVPGQVRLRKKLGKKFGT